MPESKSLASTAAKYIKAALSQVQESVDEESFQSVGALAALFTWRNVDYRVSLEIVENQRPSNSVVESSTSRFVDGVEVLNKNSHCEIRFAGGWKLVPVEEARALGSREIKRCPECHSKVKTLRSGGPGNAAHFEHFRRHDGCSHSYRFNGVKTPNPRAIED